MLDCTQFMAGPFCTLLLADMGADVIKVERPQGGDDVRRAAPDINGVSAPFLIINRNKRSLAIDLKTPQGNAAFLRVASTADVIVENFRPGTLARLGLGYEQLSEVNHSIIFCSISGFGQSGPYQHRGGFDLVAQGMSGIMSVTGSPGSDPVKVGVPITDLAAGMYGANAVMAAYIHRLKTGQGQRIDTSLLEAGIALTFWETAIYWASGEIPTPLGSAHRLNAPYQALKCQDKYITIGAANQNNWERLVEALGRQDLLAHPEFETDPLRRQNYMALASELECTLLTHPADHWLSLLEQAGVPSGPINTMAEVYDDPHVLDRDMVVYMDHPVAGRIKTIGFPVKLSKTPVRFQRPAPLLGQHTESVLEESGFTTQEITNLVEHEAVKTYPPRD